MKKNLIIINLSIIILVLLTFIIVNNRLFHSSRGTAESQKNIYYCPMHPQIHSDKPGDCPICGMTLIKKGEDPALHYRPKGKRKILFYRNPMNPEVTSKIFIKDPMGMDYIPVYEDEEKAKEETGVYISPEKQQLINIQTEMAEYRILTNQVQAVGKVAYDPDLYIAQVEYLSALNSYSSIKKDTGSLVSDQARSLLSASRQKLLIQGMSDDQISELARIGKPSANLFIPGAGKTIWVYINIYEYEIGLIKEGQLVIIDTTAYPGQIFHGRIYSITPILDPETRSVQVRAEVNNTGNKLKPEMYVNARINIVLGKRLAVPTEAVMDTGERTVVFVAKSDGYFEPREVKLGEKTRDFYEVLSGLKPGEKVVTSGNFFVDSESRLKSAITTESYKQK